LVDAPNSPFIITKLNTILSEQEHIENRKAWLKLLVTMNPPRVAYFDLKMHILLFPGILAFNYYNSEFKLLFLPYN